MSERKSDHEVLSWTDYRGKEQKRTVRMTLDVRDFLGTPGYSLLVVAANTGLAVSDLVDYLDLVSGSTPGVARTPNWIQKRRWLFQKPGTTNPQGGRANQDGKQERALTIIQMHPNLSLHLLRKLLLDHGITRSKEWIRRHRVATPTTVSP